MDGKAGTVHDRWVQRTEAAHQRMFEGKSQASSFAEASDDLRELADVEISPTHLWRLSERIGEEWAEIRDKDAEKFRKAELERAHKEPPQGRDS